jgi:hypothetical protein
MTTKSASIKDAGGKFGGRVSQAVELIAGGVNSKPSNSWVALRQPISLG